MLLRSIIFCKNSCITPEIQYYFKLPFFNCDYLALEGFNEAVNVPKIVCAKNTEGIDDKFNDSVFAISGKISSELKEYKGIKVINGLTDITELVDLVEKHAIDSKELANL